MKIVNHIFYTMAQQPEWAKAYTLLKIHDQTLKQHTL